MNQKVGADRHASNIKHVPLVQSTKFTSYKPIIQRKKETEVHCTFPHKTKIEAKSKLLNTLGI